VVPEVRGRATREQGLVSTVDRQANHPHGKDAESVWLRNSCLAANRPRRAGARRLSQAPGTPSMALRRPAGFWLAALWMAQALAGESLEAVAIDAPRHFWEERGFAAMIPSIRLPTTHEADDLIHVWLRVPEGGRIGAEYLSKQDRWSLVFPTGTRSDRVEYLRISGPEPDSETLFLPDDPKARGGWSVADVRGTVVLADGQRFHVLRPVSGEPHAPLIGRAWRRGDAQAQHLATDWLTDRAASTRRPGGRPPLDPAGISQLARLNDCARCHRRDKPRRLWQDEEIAMKRATDARGFFVPQAVLSDDCVVANHRPRDLNVEDPFVEVRCGDQPATLEEHNGAEIYSCANGRVPIGYRDVPAGLAAGHAYTERLCQSRRWLYARMTPRARRAFVRAFEVCGIGKGDS
jgi:hypothetical protein